MRSHLRLLLLPLLLLLAMADGVRAAEAAVAIVSSERSAAYQEAADAILTELARGGLSGREALQVTVAELGRQGVSARLYVALGVEAAAALARREDGVPVLCALLPSASFERLLQESGRKVSEQFSALYLNQPLTRQIDLARLALPQARRVGVLWGPDSRRQEARLDAAVHGRGLELVGVQVEPHEPLFNSLKKIVNDADFLLALPDPQVYNSGSIQNILLTSFRAQVPMVAFSPAYVRAGALLAVYSTPAQIGQQAGAMARVALQGQPLGPPQFPRKFSVSVNEHVARSLGLSLDAQTLADRLRQQEKGP